MANLSQVDALNEILKELREGLNIKNFNANIDISKVRLLVWNGSSYEVVEGYKGEIDFVYDDNGFLVEIRLKLIKEDKTTVTIRKGFVYDSSGNLTKITDWQY